MTVTKVIIPVKDTCTDPNLIPINWEIIDEYHHRAKTFGGWLFKTYAEVIHQLPSQGLQTGYDWRVSVTYIPDPHWKWKVHEPRDHKGDS